MKKGIQKLILILMIPLILAGCTEDKPMPMSQENIRDLAYELKTATSEIEFNPTKDETETLIEVYKDVLENELGYSFDKTIRGLILFYPMSAPIQMMSVAVEYIMKNPKKSFDKGFISKRTFEILDIMSQSKSYSAFTNEKIEFINFVSDCQAKNNGICNPEILLEIILSHNVLPNNGSSVNYALEERYDLFHMGLSKWLVKPDGSEINTNGLLSKNNKYEFIINKPQIEIEKKLSQLIEEEKRSLYN